MMAGSACCWRRPPVIEQMIFMENENLLPGMFGPMWDLHFVYKDTDFYTRLAAAAKASVTRPLANVPAYRVDFPIDLVYLWVDGSDPAWRASYAEHVNIQPPDGSNFANADELRFSLRSVELYAPWINRIFIVTAGQVPAWLNVDHPKVQIVDHSAIIPAEHLPAFNSTVIERFIGRIPNLSEHFLYANDDTFFAAPLQPGNFFNSAGLALMYLSKAIDSEDAGGGVYSQMKRNAAKLLTNIFGEQRWRRSWHQIKPYRRSMFDAIERAIPSIVNWVSPTRTRSSGDVAWNCIFWPSYSVAAGFATEVPADRRLSAGYADVRHNAAEAQKAFGCHLGCVNNASPCTAPAVQKEILRYFPDACEFERLMPDIRQVTAART